MSSNELSILVIDDHDLVRAGISAAASELSANACIFSAASIAEGTALLNKHPDIDLVLLDLILPDATAFSGLETILHLNPEIPVILLTADSRRETMDEAFLKGASGYIPKSSNMAIIVNALRIILAGGRYLPGEMLNDRRSHISLTAKDTLPPSLPHASQESAIPSAKEEFPAADHYLVYGLTPRQIAVADLLRRGLSNKEICRELDLGISTIKTHIASILRALRTTSRTKAMALLNSDKR